MVFEYVGLISYLHSIVTAAVSCRSIISEIKRDICRKSRFFSFDDAYFGGLRGNIAVLFRVVKLECFRYPMKMF